MKAGPAPSWNATRRLYPNKYSNEAVAIKSDNLGLNPVIPDSIRNPEVNLPNRKESTYGTIN
jgi:hypothetical protein